MIDREARKIRIGLSRRHIVIRVVSDGGKIRGAQRLPQQAESDAVRRTEQVSHEVVSLGRVQLVIDQPG